MNNNRKLLELAAKAAGVNKKWTEWQTCRIGKFKLTEYTKHEGFKGWNPLTDDGDALRLAIKCGIDISDAQINYWDKESNDPYAATRRAIVHAAAEIAKTM